HVQGVFNQQGQRIGQYDYSPYGSVGSSNYDLQPFGMSTKRSDFASGLVYFGYRFYMPNLGRWLNRDPLQEQGGINLYAYVNGDPLGYVDPDGRFGFAGAGWGFFAGGIGGYISSGNIEGAALGAVAGAAVGFVFPINSAMAGAAAGATASTAGQAAGLWLNGKDPTSLSNYNCGSILGAAIGGGLSYKSTVILNKYMPIIRFNIIGRPLMQNGISKLPAEVSSSFSEGVIGGFSELEGGNVVKSL
ncbi:RHS repeat-associated core domain-containing protein, partial [Photobacterium swingsii]